MARIRTVVIDDDILSRDMLVHFVAEDSDLALTGTFPDGPAAMDHINKETAELVLLDIEMPTMNGIQVARTIGKLRPAPVIVFVTAHDQHALQAFELEAVDYLVKPFNKARFIRAIGRAKRMIGLANQVNSIEQITDNSRIGNNDGDSDCPVIVLSHGDEVYRVTPEQIIWCEAASQYVVLHTDLGEFVKAESLSAFSKRLIGRREFIRVHRSALVNGTRIDKVLRTSGSSYRILMDCGAEIALARSRKKLLESILSLVSPRSKRSNFDNSDRSKRKLQTAP